MKRSLSSSQLLCKLINCIISTNSIFRYLYSAAGNKLTDAVLEIFDELISVSAKDRTVLLEILAKDSKDNKAEAYLTKIHAFWEGELERLQAKPSPDKVNLIQVVNNISEQGGRFGENICQIIGNCALLTVIIFI